MKSLFFKRLFLLVISIIYVSIIQSQTTFSTTIGTEANESAPLIENLGEDFILLYNIYSTENLQINQQVSLNHLSKEGEIEEIYRFKNDTTIFVVGDILKHDGYYYCHGLKKHVDSTYYRNWIFKIDDDLSILWQKEYSSPFTKTFHHSNMAFFKGEIIISSTNYILDNDFATEFLRIDLNGSLKKQKTYNEGNSIIYDILVSDNMLENNFYAFGHWSYYCNIRLTLNEDFEIVDQRFSYMTLDQDVEKINETTYIHAGQRALDSKVCVHVQVVDTNMTVYHEKYFTYGTSEEQHIGAYSALKYAGGDNYFLGWYTHVNFTFTQSPSYVILNKLNSNLDVQWQKIYGGDARYILYSLRVTTDGGCIIAGRRYDWTTQDNEHDIFVMKVNEDGLITATTDPEFTVTEAIVYPNPGSDVIHVQSAFQMEKFQLIDLNGRVILEQNLHGEDATINSSAIKSGVYIYRIIGKNNKIESGKWVKR